MKKILVVDDRDEVRRALAGLLAAEGYEIVEATDGSQVSDKVRKHRPDLVLLDIIMPVMTGFDVLKSLKKDPTLRSIPVIMVSGAMTGANMMRARELGALDFVAKSPPDGVIARVHRVLDPVAVEAS
jgi:CheY-like chemotaxis protein